MSCIWKIRQHQMTTNNIKCRTKCIRFFRELSTEHPWKHNQRPSPDQQSRDTEVDLIFYFSLDAVIWTYGSFVVVGIHTIWQITRSSQMKNLKWNFYLNLEFTVNINITICFPKIIDEARIQNLKRWIIRYHDNPSSYFTSQKVDFLTSKNIELMTYYTYSPDLSSCNFFLFPNTRHETCSEQF